MIAGMDFVDIEEVRGFIGAPSRDEFTIIAVERVGVRQAHVTQQEDGWAFDVDFDDPADRDAWCDKIAAALPIKGRVRLPSF